MFVVTRVPFDGGMCSRQPTTAHGTDNGILGKNFCQSVRELAAHGLRTNSGSLAILAAISYVYYESEPGRRPAAKLLSKDEARRLTVGVTHDKRVRRYLRGPRCSGEMQASKYLI